MGSFIALKALKKAETTIFTKEDNMKRITIVLLVLTVFGTAAWSQMGGGMMGGSTQQLSMIGAKKIFLTF